MSSLWAKIGLEWATPGTRRFFFKTVFSGNSYFIVYKMPKITRKHIRVFFLKKNHMGGSLTAMSLFWPILGILPAQARDTRTFFQNFYVKTLSFFVS